MNDLADGVEDAQRRADRRAQQQLAEEVHSLRQQISGLTRANQMSRGSVIERPLTVYDADENPIMEVGPQWDGTTAVTPLVGPEPPIPTAPVVSPGLRTAVVRWDGAFEPLFDDEGNVIDDLVVAPMDFARVEIHASTDPDVTGENPETFVGAFESPRGGARVVPLPTAGEDYTIKLVTRAQTGKRSDASDGAVVQADDVPGGVTAPPTKVPEVTVVGMPTALLVRADNVEPTSELAYYISTDPDFAPSPATLAAPPTRATVSVIYQLPDGTALAPGTPYYVRVVPQNTVGVGVASDVAQGQLDLEAIAEVVAQTVVAGFILTGSIQIGQITVDANNGIRVPQPDGTFTQLSANGSGSTFAGQATFNATTILGALSILGLDNYLNGLVTLGNGVPNPGSQIKEVTTGWNGRTVAPGASTTRRGLAETDTLWLSTDRFGTLASGVTWYAKDGSGNAFELFPLLSGWLGIGGITRIGDRYYILAAEADGGTWVKNNWRVLVYGVTDLAYKGSFASQIGTTGTGSPSIGNDGANIVVAWVTSTGGLRTRRLLTDGTLLGGIVTLDSSATLWGAATNITSVSVTAQGFAGTRWVLTTSGRQATWVYSVSGSAGTRVSAEEWPLATPQTLGMLLGADGYWHTFNGQAVYDYTWNTGTWDFTYTWMDDDPLGGGTAETKAAPIRRQTPARFAYWTMELPSKPPDDLSVDGANTAALYAAPAGSTPVRQAALAETVYKRTFSALVTSGTTPPVVSGFATRVTTAAGAFESGKTDSKGPLIRVSGDGSWRLGHLAGTIDGKDANDTGWILLPLTSGTASTLTVPYVRMRYGRVEFKGFVNRNGGFTAGQVVQVASLPANFPRPPADNQRIDFQLPGPSANASVRAYIEQTGAITVVTGPTGTIPGYVSLAPLTYSVD